MKSFFLISLLMVLWILSGCLEKTESTNLSPQNQAQNLSVVVAAAATATPSPSPTAKDYSKQRVQATVSSTPVGNEKSGSQTQSNKSEVSLYADFRKLEGNILPFYDQTESHLKNYYYPGTTTSLISDKVSNICGPTSAAMILQGMINQINKLSSSNTDSSKPTYSLPNGTWMTQKFINKDYGTQVAHLAAQMDKVNIVTSGTSWKNAKNVVPGKLDSADNCSWEPQNVLCMNLLFPKRLVKGTEEKNHWIVSQDLMSDFNFASGPSLFVKLLSNVDPTKVEDSLNNLEKSPSSEKAYAVLLDYGHYYAKRSKGSTGEVSYYERDGGHFVVVSGYYDSSSKGGNPVFVVHDPWGGVQQLYTIASFTNKAGVKYRDSSQKLIDLSTINNSKTQTTAAGMGYIVELSHQTYDPDYYAIIEGYGRLPFPLE